MIELTPEIATLGASALAGISGFLVMLWRNRGTVRTTTAESLWGEMQKLRQEAQRDIKTLRTQLEEERHQCDARLNLHSRRSMAIWNKLLEVCQTTGTPLNGPFGDIIKAIDAEEREMLK